MTKLENDVDRSFSDLRELYDSNSILAFTCVVYLSDGCIAVLGSGRGLSQKSRHERAGQLLDMAVTTLGYRDEGETE